LRKICATLCNNARPLFFGGFPNPPRRKKKSGIPKKKLWISQEEVGEIPREEIGDFQMIVVWVIDLF